MALQVRDLTPEFGAEIEGVDLRSELGDDDRRALQDAFDERGLLVFRGLDLEPEHQASVAAMLIGDRGSAAGEAPEEIEPAKEFYVSNKEAGGGAPYGRLLFHSDMMWAEKPFQVLSLYGQEVEQPAVPTQFVSAASAWDRLPDDLRARVDGLHALHVTGQQRRGDDEDALLQPEREQEQTTTTLIGHPHPRTGRVLLYVCQMMTREIVELPPDESEALLGDLFTHLYDPAHMWRHDWREGDLVAWDNQAIQHARADVAIDGPTRTLRKVIAPKPVFERPPEMPRFSKAS